MPQKTTTTADGAPEQKRYSKNKFHEALLSAFDEGFDDGNYAPLDNGLADFVDELFELAKAGKSPRLAQAMAQFIETQYLDPEDGEYFFV